jgi:uncharacterized membrane protein YiaA
MHPVARYHDVVMLSKGTLINAFVNCCERGFYLVVCISCVFKRTAILKKRKCRIVTVQQEVAINETT